MATLRLAFIVCFSSFVQCQLDWVEIKVNGYSPIKMDEYVAVTIPAPPGYIIRFEPAADPNSVHHMLLYGCNRAAGRIFWKGGATCLSGRKILFAWARNATELILPAGVGFSVGHWKDTVHYSHLLDVPDFSGVRLQLIQSRPPKLAGVLLFASFQSIPALRETFYTNASCLYKASSDLYPFAFRTHTHALGRLVSGAFEHDGTWTVIGKRNPQWPQMFELIGENFVIRSGDLMAATCRYDSSQKQWATYMGRTGAYWPARATRSDWSTVIDRPIRARRSCWPVRASTTIQRPIAFYSSTGKDEMCNFYMMFAWNANEPDPFPDRIGCYGDEERIGDGNYPEWGQSLLPSRPDLELHAHQGAMPMGGPDK